jgi:apolipoprotein D and lipocalin family protein
MKKQIRTLFTLACTVMLTACASGGQEMKTVDNVDLERFMGDWYVVGNIPTFLEKGVHNAVENYALNDDGTIATTFTFNKDSFEGKEKTYTPKGFVKEGTGNAIWGMRFVWPIKADYRIVYLNEDYSQTIIGRQKRDYVWIMTRSPNLPDAEYERLLGIVGELGYDVAKVIKVPHQQ